MAHPAALRLVILVAFAANSLFLTPLQADPLILPNPGVLVSLSSPFSPAILRGLKVHPEDPLRLDFILDRGQGSLSQTQLDAESQKLLKYFLASMTVPENDLWVNLSPYEQNRIVPDRFGLTEMGRDLLAQDYLLKQMTASLMYPEKKTGKKFWEAVYRAAGNRSLPSAVALSTFNKVWIVPEKAVVYENGKAHAAYVVETKLKVLLEQDYLATSKNAKAPDGDSQTAQILRQLVIPALEREINEGQNFHQLRQIYHSLILATWYKQKIKDSILSMVYADQNKVAGVQHTSPVNIQAIYDRYLQSFRKGVYNFIKDDVDPVTQNVIPRKYFSGGMKIGVSSAMVVEVQPSPALAESLSAGHAFETLAVRLSSAPGDSAQLSDSQLRAFMSGPAAILLPREREIGHRFDERGRFLKPFPWSAGFAVPAGTNSRLGRNLASVKIVKKLKSKVGETWLRLKVERRSDAKTGVNPETEYYVGTWKAQARKWVLRLEHVKEKSKIAEANKKSVDDALANVFEAANNAIARGKRISSEKGIGAETKINSQIEKGDTLNPNDRTVWLLRQEQRKREAARRSSPDAPANSSAKRKLANNAMNSYVVKPRGNDPLIGASWKADARLADITSRLSGEPPIHYDGARIMPGVGVLSQVFRGLFSEFRDYEVTSLSVVRQDDKEYGRFGGFREVVKVTDPTPLLNVLQVTQQQGKGPANINFWVESKAREGAAHVIEGRATLTPLARPGLRLSPAQQTQAEQRFNKSLKQPAVSPFKASGFALNKGDEYSNIPEWPKRSMGFGITATSGITRSYLEAAAAVQQRSIPSQMLLALYALFFANGFVAPDFLMSGLQVERLGAPIEEGDRLQFSVKVQERTIFQSPKSGKKVVILALHYAAMKRVGKDGLGDLVFEGTTYVQKVLQGQDEAMTASASVKLERSHAPEQPAHVLVRSLQGKSIQVVSGREYHVRPSSKGQRVYLNLESKDQKTVSAPMILDLDANGNVIFVDVDLTNVDWSNGTRENIDQQGLGGLLFELIGQALPEKTQFRSQISNKETWTRLATQYYLDNVGQVRQRLNNLLVVEGREPTQDTITLNDSLKQTLMGKLWLKAGLSQLDMEFEIFGRKSRGVKGLKSLLENASYVNNPLYEDVFLSFIGVKIDSSAMTASAVKPRKKDKEELPSVHQMIKRLPVQDRAADIDAAMASWKSTIGAALLSAGLVFKPAPSAVAAPGPVGQPTTAQESILNQLNTLTTDGRNILDKIEDFKIRQAELAKVIGAMSHLLQANQNWIPMVTMYVHLEFLSTMMIASDYDRIFHQLEILGQAFERAYKESPKAAIDVMVQIDDYLTAEMAAFERRHTRAENSQGVNEMIVTSLRQMEEAQKSIRLLSWSLLMSKNRFSSQAMTSYDQPERTFEPREIGKGIRLVAVKSWNEEGMQAQVEFEGQTRNVGLKFRVPRVVREQEHEFRQTNGSTFFSTEQERRNDPSLILTKNVRSVDWQVHTFPIIDGSQEVGFIEFRVDIAGQRIEISLINTYSNFFTQGWATLGIGLLKVYIIQKGWGTFDIVSRHEESVINKEPGYAKRAIEKVLTVDNSVSRGGYQIISWKIRDVENSIKEGQAMTARGGVDFRESVVSKALTIPSAKSSMLFKFDPAMHRELEQAPGLKPVILKRQPLSDPYSFLGLTQPAIQMAAVPAS